MELGSRTRAVLAWALWLVAFGCCAAGLLVTLAISRPLTAAVLVEGAVYAFFFVLGFATVGLVLALRRPENPIGWLYLAAGLAWAYTIPVQPWIDQLVREHRPLPLVPQLVAAIGDLSWAPGLAGPAGNVAAVLTIVGVVLRWSSLPPAAVCVVLQFRSSRGVERQHLRWVAAGSSRSWTGASTAAATTPPAPWRRSRPGCATRSTWTRCTASAGRGRQTMQPTRASLWLRHAP
jgi:hypothetical protein